MQTATGRGKNKINNEYPHKVNDSFCHLLAKKKFLEKEKIGNIK